MIKRSKVFKLSRRESKEEKSTDRYRREREEYLTEKPQSIKRLAREIAAKDFPDPMSPKMSFPTPFCLKSTKLSA